ncbi:hypothetical protein BRC67_10735 [Halobacteriales archaeon QH_3_68_24]|nr:MAG: hypothetical protein BRC67_10735 [Halobacteriales archaeon QH_3_68_24]
MNWHRHLELVPHYLANLVLVLLAVGALRRVAGDPGTPVELAAVVAVVLAYPSVVRRLGVAPSAWEDPG